MVVSKKMLQTPSPSICFYVPVPTAMIWQENLVCVCLNAFLSTFLAASILNCTLLIHGCMQESSNSLFFFNIEFP